MIKMTLVTILWQDKDLEILSAIQLFFIVVQG